MDRHHMQRRSESSNEDTASDMLTYFHGGFGHDEHFLFNILPINSLSGLVAAMSLTFVLGIFSEIVKSIRDRRNNSQEGNRNLISGDSAPSYETATISELPSLKEAPVGLFERMKMPLRDRGRVYDSVLYGLQLLLSYLLMLVVMTYNYWLCLSAITGAVLGHFILSKPF